MLKSRFTCFAAAATAFALAAYAFLPALAAGFHVEDYAYVALMRHLPSPWPLLVDNIFFVYYYRATGMLLWWLSVQVAGTDAWWHNLFDLLVHASNAALLAVLASQLARSTLAGAMAGISFASLPAAASTAMWMSDRYDPLALLFGLLALIAFERAIAGSRTALTISAGALLLAIAAKEVAFAVAGVMLVRSLLIAWKRRALPIALLLAAIVPVAVALALRVLTVQSLDASLGVTDLIDATIRGSLAWWQRLPAALVGFHVIPGAATMLLAGTAVCVSIALALGIATRREGVRPLSATGALLVLIPSMIQWPVTSLVLTHDSALDFVVNLRFYHLAMAGIALLLGAAILSLRRAPSRFAFALLLLPLCVGGVLLTRTTADAWATTWAPLLPAYQTLANQLGARTFPAGCHIELGLTALPAVAQGHIDTIVKAGVPDGASILHCSISATVPSHVTLVDGNVCQMAAWPAFGIRQFGDKPALQRMGPLCAISFDGSDQATIAAPRFSFLVSTSGDVAEVPSVKQPIDLPSATREPGDIP